MLLARAYKRTTVVCVREYLLGSGSSTVGRDVWLDYLQDGGEHR